MDNERAKELYTQAMGHFQAQQFGEALAILDDLDRERPNSRHVMQHRALCLLRLNRVDEAQMVAAKLEGKAEPAVLSDLRAKIAAAREASHAPQASTGGADGGDNVFVVEQVFPTSTTETTVTGFVKSGVFHQGDSLTLVSPTGMPLIAPLMRIGKAETPLKIIRAGQSTVFLLQVEPHHVVPGSSITCQTEEESYAATMVVDSGSGAGAKLAAFIPELLEIERMVKTGNFQEAHARLTAHLAENPDSGGAHRLLARVHLEGPAPFKDPKKALEHIRRAYELGGAEDPAVVNVLADALAANGEAEHGLRFIERLHGAAQEPAARHALAKHIYDFRNRHNLGHVWEFSDEYGDVVFESRDVQEIVKALSSGTVPKTAKCRRDHAGDWRDAAELLAAEHPDLARLYQSGRGAKGKGGANKALVAVVVLLILVLALVLARNFLG